MSEMAKFGPRCIEILEEATAAINWPYFQLPIAGREDPQFRERVYCYELYHQMRLHMHKTEFPFTLSGEIDKAGHLIIRNGYLEKIKPDFVLHTCGMMKENLCVIEVKPINGQKEGVEKDLQTLTAMTKLEDGPYHLAILLVYGGSTDEQTVKKMVLKASDQAEDKDSIDLKRIRIFWQKREKSPAIEVFVP